MTKVWFEESAYLVYALANKKATNPIFNAFLYFLEIMYFGFMFEGYKVD
jgi:hypothetical protein